MTTTPIKAADLQPGDLVRLTKGDTIVTSRIRLRGGWLENLDIDPARRERAGWTLELIDRPVPEPAAGVYVWPSKLHHDGTIDAYARIVKRQGGKWVDGNGRYLNAHAGVDNAYATGMLVGPIRVAKSQRPDPQPVGDPF